MRKKKKFNISAVLYVICAIMIVIIIPCAAGIAEDSFRIKGRMKGYEEEKLYYDFINNDYAELIEKTEYNIGIGRKIDDGTQDYYLFADAYKKAIDYNVCVNSGNTDKAEKLLKDINSVHFDNVIFEEALENVKLNYIEKGLTE